MALERLGKKQEQSLYIEQRGISFKLILDKTLYFFSESNLITAVTVEEERSFPGKLGEMEESLTDYFQPILTWLI